MLGIWGLGVRVEVLGVSDQGAGFKVCSLSFVFRVYLDGGRG